MVRVYQISMLIFMLTSSDIEASPRALNFALQAANQSILKIGRSTGIPGMFGRFTVILNGKVLAMLGENQVIEKKLSPGPHTLTIRDDVEYRKFLGTTVRFSINPSQKIYLMVYSEKRAFDSQYIIVVKKVIRN
ncbi:hypothetical protein OA343_02700 [Paracoccaceae bacterium]|nr:hypothetical protein [Paracoccaceae bacterium]